MRVAVLGPLAIDGDEGGTAPRDRVVLEALAAATSRYVSTDQLAEALWSDEPPDSSTKVVQGCVSRLRRRLGRSVIETTANGYRLNLSAADVDSARFEQLVDRGRELLSVGQPARAARALDQALALWRGRPFHDLDEWEMARLERRRLEELMCEAEELGVDARLRAGEHLAVLPTARRNAEREPFRERRWAQLARAEYQAGRQTDALRTLATARETLLDRAGLDPSEALRALESAILRQDPELDVPAAPGDRGVCPYPGLVPFDVDDSELFFGREDVIDACVGVAQRKGVVAIVGPSGSGKSSLVRAGIAAAWRQSGRGVQIITPSAAQQLAVSSISADLLVVDQLEESISLPDGNSVLDVVTAAARRTTVVLAIRADRLGDLSAHAGVTRLIERGLVLLQAMTDEELRRAIEQPARVAGLLLEAGLVDLLLREVEGEPGALPLLSHALRATWERREDAVLTVAGYRESGGLRGAVAQTAENLYRALDQPDQTIVRDLMLRMLVPTVEGDAIGSPIPRRLIVSDRERERLVEQLIDARLVTSDGETVELAHEALVRGWPRLRTWIDDDVDGQRILRHLTLAADGWDAMGRPNSELYRGPRLSGALAWRRRVAPALTPLETEFLAASERVADADHEEIAARSKAEVRQNRRLRSALIAAAVLLVAAVVAGSVAVRSADRARSQASAAQQTASASLVGLSHGVLEDDRGLALLLAIEAHRTAPSNATRAAMLGALFDAPLRRTSILTPADDHYGLAIDASGTVAAAKRPDGSIDVIDLVERSVRHVALPGGPTLLGGVAVDPEGRFVASGGSSDVDTVVYDLETATPVASFPSADGVTVPVFSPDGELLALGRESGTLTLYDTESWEVRTSVDIGAPLSALAFDDVGSRVFVATVPSATSPGATTTARNATLIGFEVDSGEMSVGPTETSESFVSSIATWPGRDQLVIAGWQFTLIDSTDLTPIGESFGRVEVDLVTVAVSPDGMLFAGSPVELHVHDLTTENGPERVTTVASGSPGVAVTADGSVLVTADINGAISLRTLEARRDVGEVLSADAAGQVKLSPSGDQLVVWDDGFVTVVGVRTADGHELPIDGAARVLGVDIDASSERIATLTCPPEPTRCVAELDLWDLATGQRLVGPQHVGEVWPGLGHGVAFAQQDRTLAVPLLSGVVASWTASTLEPQPLQLDVSDHTALAGDSAWGLDAVDVDGRSLLVAQDELGQSVTWDVTDDLNQPLGSLENAFRMQYLPDGRLVTATAPGSLVLRDPFTLEPITDALPGTIPADTYSLTDGGILVASGDHGVQLFDLGSRTLITPEALPGTRSAITADGRTLYLGTGHDGDPVRVIPLDGDELVEDACRRAGRNLSLDEWERLIGSESEYRPTCGAWHSANRDPG